MLRLITFLTVLALATGSLTVYTNYTTDYRWSFQDQLNGQPSWTALPLVATTVVPAPTVATGVKGCIVGPCYDTRFLREFLAPGQLGIASILVTASNPGNTLGAALVLNSTNVRWI